VRWRLNLHPFSALSDEPRTISFQAQAPAGVALLLFSLALPVFLLPLRPLMARMSRRDAREARALARRTPPNTH